MYALEVSLEMKINGLYNDNEYMDDEELDSGRIPDLTSPVSRGTSAFEKLQQAMTKAPILSSKNFHEEFTIVTNDAPGYGIGSRYAVSIPRIRRIDTCRRPQSAPVRRVEAMVVEGSRRRGRPKLRWKDRLKMDMKELRLSEDMTSDRNTWRDRIRISRGRICLHFTSPIPRPGGIGYVVVVVDRIDCAENKDWITSRRSIRLYEEASEVESCPSEIILDDLLALDSIVVQIVLWYLDSGCSKHMTGDRSRLLNFVKKFIGTVRFGNNHFGAIMGYGDYVVGESVISRFITQIQVGLNKTVRYVRTDNGTEFVNHTMTEYYERIGIFHQKTVPRAPQQNGVVERRNRTLVEAARTMLIFSKALMFLWAEAVATACYTQNCSLIHTRHYKTPYELVHNKKPDLTFFRVFGALCYPTNDSEDLGKLQPTADTGIFVGYAPSRKGSGLVPNSVPATPYAPPTNKELEILFQPMFDEYLKPPRVERPDSPAQAVQVSVSSSGTPLSTTIDQDAPSPHILPSSSALQSHSLPPGVVAEPHFMEDHTVASVDTNPFVNVFAPEPYSEASSSGDISSTESPYVSQILHHLNK
nr:hypothetical protein [Tanacetum cinerariifolium]